MQPGSLRVSDLSSYFHYTHLNHPIYIDSLGVFEKDNPHIPADDLYHIIMLNKNNDVILVGNPLFNPKIEKLFLQLISENLDGKKPLTQNITIQKE